MIRWALFTTEAKDSASFRNIECYYRRSYNRVIELSKAGLLFNIPKQL